MPPLSVSRRFLHSQWFQSKKQVDLFEVSCILRMASYWCSILEQIKILRSIFAMRIGWWSIVSEPRTICDICMSKQKSLLHQSFNTGNWRPQPWIKRKSKLNDYRDIFPSIPLWLLYDLFRSSMSWNVTQQSFGDERILVRGSRALTQLPFIARLQPLQKSSIYAFYVLERAGKRTIGKLLSERVEKGRSYPQGTGRYRSRGNFFLIAASHFKLLS